MVIIFAIVMFAICTIGFSTHYSETEKQKRNQTVFEKRLDYLHGCRRDRFDFAGKANTPYQDALAALDRLERGEYPIKGNDGKIFNLYDIEDYITDQEKRKKYLGKGVTYRPAIFVDRYDSGTREYFRQGKVMVGKDITMYEKPQLMTFAAAREYMAGKIREEMKRIWGN